MLDIVATSTLKKNHSHITLLHSFVLLLVGPPSPHPLVGSSLKWMLYLGTYVDCVQNTNSCVLFSFSALFRFALRDMAGAGAVESEIDLTFCGAKAVESKIDSLSGGRIGGGK